MGNVTLPKAVLSTANIFAVYPYKEIINGIINKIEKNVESYSVDLVRAKKYPLRGYNVHPRCAFAQNCFELTLGR